MAHVGALKERLSLLLFYLFGLWAGDCRRRLLLKGADQKACFGSDGTLLAVPMSKMIMSLLPQSGTSFPYALLSL
jgi:hypothetical protein